MTDEDLIILVTGAETDRVERKESICDPVLIREERRLIERRRGANLPFDTQPLASTTLDDLGIDRFRLEVLPQLVARTGVVPQIMRETIARRHRSPPNSRESPGPSPDPAQDPMLRSARERSATRPPEGQLRRRREAVSERSATMSARQDQPSYRSAARPLSPQAGSPRTAQSTDSPKPPPAPHTPLPQRYHHAATLSSALAVRPTPWLASPTAGRVPRTAPGTAPRHRRRQARHHEGPEP